jgi:hypothetical protein
MKITALLLSTGEPQLTRCLNSIYNQTVPFHDVIHISGVIPEYNAFNEGISRSCTDWTLKINGDFILFDNAVELIDKVMEEHFTYNVCSFNFGLFDPFVQKHIGFACVFKTQVYQKYKYTDTLMNDRQSNDFLREKGYRIRKFMHTVVGTHFEDPDEFQTFVRFYTFGVKFGRGLHTEETLRNLKNLYNLTGNPLYELAMEAIYFSRFKKRLYVGSHNLEFDKLLFEEFKCQKLASSFLREMKFS